MRNYIVSTLVSLALASPFALADEAPAPEIKTPEPKVVIPEVKAPELPDYIVKAKAEAKEKMQAVQTKRNAHHEEMEALLEKMKAAKTQEERQTLMQERMELIRKHHQEMQELMSQDMPEAPTSQPRMSEEEWKQMIQERMEAAQEYREQMYNMAGMSGYEGYGYAPRYAYPPAPYYGGYAPAPNYNYPPMPQMPKGKYCDKHGKDGKHGKHAMKQEMMKQKMEHRAKMEQTMQNIEATLKEMLELLKAK